MMNYYFILLNIIFFNVVLRCLNRKLNDKFVYRMVLEVVGGLLGSCVNCLGIEVIYYLVGGGFV